MRIILSGGGTAGHVYPAIAIAEEIIRQDQSSEILFVCRKNGKESSHIIKSGFKATFLDIRGIKRKITTENLKVISCAIKARAEAERIIKEFKPDFIVGTGGYVCWPVLSAGQSLNIPTAIHESNSVPGLTTRLLAHQCRLVFLNYKEAAKRIHTKGKIIVVGCPLRSDFTRISRMSARRSLRLLDNDVFILSFGGSIGAEKLNSVVIESMKNYSSKKNGVVHYHATGERYYKDLASGIKEDHFSRCRIFPYFNDMPRLMKAADIVVSRCGAVTLSELSAVGVAAILIPSPNVSGNHQLKNARLLSERGAAVVIEESKLTEKLLTDTISCLEINENERKNRAKLIRSFYFPNSAKTVVNELKGYIYDTNR